MPLHIVYIWSRISAVVLLGVVSLKGLLSPPVAIEEAPMVPGFGWEKFLNPWAAGVDPVQPDKPDPIQTQIDKCDLMSERASGTCARYFCKLQKVKLQGLSYVTYIVRKTYSFADAILPTFGGGGYVMIFEILMLTGAVFFTVKTQNSLRMLTEKLYGAVAGKSGRAQSDTGDEDGMLGGQKDDDEELKSMDLGNPHEADGLGTAGGEDLAFSGSPGGRRFHGELAFQDGNGEEVSASNEVSCSEVDGKMKKEVRFSDDAFDGHGISDTYVSKTVNKVSPGRRVSPVKRMMAPEPASKNCAAKMGRPVPTAAAGAGATGSGIGSRASSWHP